MGHKADLHVLREVSYEEGRALADQLGCPFFEASAKLDLNMREVFVQCCAEMRKLGLEKDVAMPRSGKCVV